MTVMIMAANGIVMVLKKQLTRGGPEFFIGGLMTMVMFKLYCTYTYFNYIIRFIILNKMHCEL